MHYKNGREAREGDPVIIKQNPGTTYQKVVAGVLHSLQPGCVSCNAQIAYAVPGTVTSTSVTIGECFHAEDAIKSLEVGLTTTKTCRKCKTEWTGIGTPNMCPSCGARDCDEKLPS
jgi:hypothetical protein